MTGMPRYSLPGERTYSTLEEWMPWIVLGVILAMGAGMLLFFAWAMGRSQADLEHWTKQVRDCKQYEEREFVAQGFLFFSGSGEITKRTVCVKWEITR